MTTVTVQALHDQLASLQRHACMLKTRCFSVVTELLFSLPVLLIVIIIMMRSIQPKPPAVAILRQNGLSSASCGASVAVTLVSGVDLDLEDSWQTP